MERYLIIKSIFKKVKLDDATILLGFFSLLIGYFKEYIYVLFIVFAHELGHSVIALLLKKEVYKINIYPFGGESIINVNMNMNIIKELIILIMGPIFQLIGTLILMYVTNSLDDKLLIKNISLAIIIFNMLPVYPLDGGKIINNLLNIYFDIQKSFKISIFISYITILFLIIYFRKSMSLSIIYMILFLLYKVLKERNEYNYNYNIFLTDRYLNKYIYKKIKIVNNIKSFYRNKKNIIKVNDNYYTENDMLSKRYK